MLGLFSVVIRRKKKRRWIGLKRKMQKMNDERFICVWIGNDQSGKKDSLDAQDELGRIVDSFRYFDHVQQSIDFCISIPHHTKILLILLHSISENILHLIESFEQIHSIYIFNPSSFSSIDDYSYEKIQGIFNNVKSLCEKMKKNLLSIKRKPFGITFLSSSDIQSNDRNNRQDPLFMYSQLLKDLVLNDQFNESDEQIKYEMLNYCRMIYSDDQSTLNILEEFDKHFIPELSINWYTRECFLYKMLNKALWTSQPDVLYKMRYFLRHLHGQIVSQSSLQNRNGRPLIVYRGQNLHENDVQKLRRNLGGFLSFHNFLSTSLDRRIAISFVAGDESGVLFEIYVDPGIQKFPFANIEHLSFQQGQENNEKEILFSMGTVFRIVGIDHEDYFHRVQLMLTNDIDQKLARYTEQTREDIRSSSCFLTFIKLIRELKQFDCLDHFLEYFHSDPSLCLENDVLDGIHNTFGLIYHDRGQFNDALKHFQLSLEICLESFPANHPRIAVTYNNIGSVYSSQSNHQQALNSYQLALDCVTNADHPNILSIITYTNNISSIYYHQEKYEDALDYLQRVLRLQIEHLGDNDPSITDTYNMMSLIHHQMGNSKQAGFSLLFHFNRFQMILF